MLADSHGLVRAAYRLLLEASERISVVGEAASGEEAVAIADRLHPDVALIDAALGGLGSVHATRQIASRVAVILLIASQDDEHSLPALRAGATGLLLKDAEPAELVRAVETLARGEALLSPEADASPDRRAGITSRASAPIIVAVQLPGGSPAL